MSRHACPIKVSHSLNHCVTMGSAASTTERLGLSQRHVTQKAHFRVCYNDYKIKGKRETMEDYDKVIKLLSLNCLLWEKTFIRGTCSSNHPCPSFAMAHALSKDLPMLSVFISDLLRDHLRVTVRVAPTCSRIARGPSLEPGLGNGWG